MQDQQNSLGILWDKAQIIGITQDGGLKAYLSQEKMIELLKWN